MFGKVESAAVTVPRDANAFARLVTCGGAGKAFRTRAKFSGFEAPFDRFLKYAGVIPPLTDIEIRGQAITGQTSMTADLEILLIDQTVLLGR
jgi:hypothetical protein